MIKLISSKVARILCEDEKHTDNYELYEYAIYILLSSAFHIAGYNASSGVYTVINNSKASWRGKMNSWWWGGKNCSATGKITAI